MHGLVAPEQRFFCYVFWNLNRIESFLSSSFKFCHERQFQTVVTFIWVIIVLEQLGFMEYVIRWYVISFDVIRCTFDQLWYGQLRSVLMWSDFIWSDICLISSDMASCGQLWCSQYDLIKYMIRCDMIRCDVIDPFLQESQIVLTVTNPIDSVMHVYFRPVEEGDDDFDNRTADVSFIRWGILIFLHTQVQNKLPPLINFSIFFQPPGPY